MTGTPPGSRPEGGRWPAPLRSGPSARRRPAPAPPARRGGRDPPPRPRGRPARHDPAAEHTDDAPGRAVHVFAVHLEHDLGEEAEREAEVGDGEGYGLQVNVVADASGLPVAAQPFDDLLPAAAVEPVADP